jgi:hypothetical protein
MTTGSDVKNRSSIYPLITVGLLFAGAASAGERYENRCGWFSNPTPANVSLYDRDGEWIIGEQGGYQIESDWPWPEFGSSNWVNTNGSYGYGCVCLEMRTDAASHHVVEIKKAGVKPLQACRRDPALRKWRKVLQ